MGSFQYLYMIQMYILQGPLLFCQSDQAALLSFPHITCKQHMKSLIIPAQNQRMAVSVLAAKIFTGIQTGKRQLPYFHPVSGFHINHICPFSPGQCSQIFIYLLPLSHHRQHQGTYPYVL